MSEDNTKLDLVYIIPMIIGSLCLSFVAARQIQFIPLVESIGFMSWVFEFGVILVVLKFGMDMFVRAMDELSNVFKKKNSQSKGRRLKYAKRKR